jgi:hypothetical protein
MANLRLTRNVFNWILLLMAAYSLVTIIVLFRIDTVVNETLYSYGLQFSSDWATLYWTTIRTGFAVSWLVIITALALQLYFTRKAKETDEKRETELWTGERRETRPRGEEPWCTYTLSDGSTIKVKHKLKSAKRLERHSPEGLPVYVVTYDNIVQVVSVPEKLVRGSKNSSG